MSLKHEKIIKKLEKVNDFIRATGSNRVTLYETAVMDSIQVIIGTLEEAIRMEQAFRANRNSNG